VSTAFLKPIIQEGRNTPGPGPIERAILRCWQDEYELLISLRRPSEQQLDAVLHGVAEFALAVEDPAILMAFRFGDAIPWSVATYERGEPTSHRMGYPVDRSSRPERRAHLDVLLIDTESGQPRASRSVVLWLDFSRRLDDAVCDQSRSRFDPSEWRRARSRLERRFPTAEILAAQSQVRSPGAC